MTMTTNFPPHPQETRYHELREYRAPRNYQPGDYQPQRDRQVERQQRRQVSVGAMVVGVLIIIAAVIGFGSDVAATGPAVATDTTVTENVSSEVTAPDAITIYVVQPGDTLWDIASSIATPGEDIRPLIDELRVIAGGSSLEVGQRLVIDHTMIRS